MTSISRYAECTSLCVCMGGRYKDGNKFEEDHYDENHIFSIEATLKHKQVACMRRKMLFTIFKYLFLI